MKTSSHEIKNKLVPRSGKALVETKNLHAFPYAVELYFFKPLIIRRPSGTLRVKQWEFQVKLGKNIFTAVRPFRVQDMIHRDLEGPISLWIVSYLLVMFLYELKTVNFQIIILVKTSVLAPWNNIQYIFHSRLSKLKNVDYVPQRCFGSTVQCQIHNVYVQVLNKRSASPDKITHNVFTKFLKLTQCFYQSFVSN